MKFQPMDITVNMRSWGNLTHLYPSLNPIIIPILEKALSAHRRGHLVEAEAIILQELPPSSTTPTIAIALADVYESQGFEFKRARVLEEALEQSAEWSSSVNDNVLLLLRILVADATIRSRGTMESMYTTLMSHKEDVVGFEINKSTEVEVSCTLWTR